MRVAGGETRTQALGVFLGRIVLGATTVILSLNLCTGLPVLALWLGSQTTGDQPFSMTGIVAALIALAILEAISLMALDRISTTYDGMIGRPPPVHQPAPWLSACERQRHNRLDGGRSTRLRRSSSRSSWSRSWPSRSRSSSSLRPPDKTSPSYLELRGSRDPGRLRAPAKGDWLAELPAGGLAFARAAQDLLGGEQP